jgi:hypothetical protein
MILIAERHGQGLADHRQSSFGGGGGRIETSDGVI